MLDRVHSVDWKNLNHAYGSAANVPDVFPLLLSPKAEDQEEAFEFLYSALWHQGSVYQATTFFVPFVVDMIQMKEVPCKTELIEFLRDVSSHGYRSRSDVCRQIYDAVVQGLPVYLTLLEGADDDVQRSLPYLLSALETHQSEILPHIYTRFFQASDVLVKTSCLLYLQYHKQFADQHPDFFVERLTQDQEGLLTQLLAATHLLEKQRYDQSVPFVAAHLPSFDEIRIAYLQLLWCHYYTDSVLARICTALLGASRTYAPLLIPVLQQTLVHLDVLYVEKGLRGHCLSVVKALLYFSCEGIKQKPDLSFPDVDDVQLASLRMVYQNELCSTHQREINPVLQHYGFPLYEEGRQLFHFPLVKKKEQDPDELKIFYDLQEFMRENFPELFREKEN